MTYRVVCTKINHFLSADNLTSSAEGFVAHTRAYSTHFLMCSLLRGNKPNALDSKLRAVFESGLAVEILLKIPNVQKRSFKASEHESAWHR